jgi:L-type amino acid transporter 9
MFSSGAEYAYFMEAFGPFFAYMFSWVSTMIIKPSQVKMLFCSHCKIIILCSVFENLRALVLKHYNRLLEQKSK